MKPAASVHDVAAYILQKHGPMTAMKLQKLLYYCQVWSLMWDDRPMFPERIEAWAYGPIVPEVYEKHRGEFAVEEWPYGSPSVLDEEARTTVDSVLEFYAPHSAQWLSDLVRRERPWIEARSGLPASDRGSQEISLASIMEYYSSLPDPDADQEAA